MIILNEREYAENCLQNGIVDTKPLSPSPFSQSITITSAVIVKRKLRHCSLNICQSIIRDMNSTNLVGRQVSRRLLPTPEHTNYIKSTA